MPSTAVHLSLWSIIAHGASQHLSSLPLPTTHYHITSVSAPVTTAFALLPRDDPVPPLTNSATCGYTSGLWFSAVTCGEDHSCTYYTEPYSAPNFGCCSSGQGCGYVSTCVEYGASNNPQTTDGVLLANKGFYCGFDAPFCTTLVLYGQEYTISGTYSFLSYSCGVGSGTRITAYQTTTGSSETPSSTTSSTTSSTISSPSSQHSSSSEASAPSETSSAPNTPTSTSKPIAASASSGLSQGAQIGIGVGAGLAAAGAFIAASLCLWRRRKVQKSVPEDTHHAHYGDTRDQFWGPSGVDQHGYPKDALNKQYQEHYAPVELTSTPARHELDSGYAR